MRFVKILSLFVSLYGAQFHRATTLRTPRELPATVQTEKVLFVMIAHAIAHFSIIPVSHAGVLVYLLGLVFPPLVVFLPVVWQITSSLSSHLVARH